MHGFLLTVHVVACVFLIIVVLLQAGRGAGLAVFGGGGDSLFASPSGSSALKKTTAIMAGTFAVTSLMLTLMSGRSEMRSVTGRFARPGIPGQPAQPGQPVPPAGQQGQAAPAGQAQPQPAQPAK